jgi:SAM-dependent methyltransferase
MKMFRRTLLWFCLFSSAPSFANPLSQAKSICTTSLRKLAFATAGVAVVPESALLHWGALKLTSRSPVFYLNGLWLWNYDFSGKRVLDLASGRSRFAQFINVFYGDTGAEGHALDYFWTPPGRFGKNGDATLMDYPDHYFDLVVSNMGLLQFPSFEFDAAYDESLRVLKPGGELRLTSSLPFFLLQRFRSKLVQHPEVESISMRPPFFSMQFPYTLKKRDAASLPSEEALYEHYRERSKDKHWNGWRPSILSKFDPGAHGSNETRTFFLNAKLMRSVPLTDEDQDFISHAIGSNSFPFHLRLNLFRTSVVRSAEDADYARFFDAICSKLDLEIRSKLFEPILDEPWSHSSFANGLWFIHRLPGPFTPEVEAKRKRLNRISEEIINRRFDRRLGGHR